MKYQSLKIIVCCSIIFILLLGNKSMNAQRYLDGGNSFWNNVSLGANVGTTLFFGDISNDASPFQDDWKLGYGLVLRKQFSPYFGFGLQFMNGKLHGTKPITYNGASSSLFFDADIMEFNAHALINFSNLIMGYKPERVINIYGYVGLGVANWSSIQTNAGSGLEVARSGFDTNGNKAWTPEMIYPFGLGVNVMLGPSFDLNFDAGMRMVNSDNVDAQASGMSKNDFYSYGSIGIAYKFSGGGGLFKSGRNKEIDYDKAAKKQQKYQDRQLRKEEKRSYRQKLEEQRLEDKRTGTKGEKPKRRRRDDGLPRVVEYDAVYTQSQAIKISDENKKKVANATKASVGSTELVVDEGKHFITGTQNQVANQNLQNDQFVDRKTNADLTDATSYTDGNILTIPNQGMIYTVQILATRVAGKNIPTLISRYRITKPVYVFKSGSLYRYSAGAFSTYEEALQYSRTLQSNGLNDAFVSVYNNGIKIQRTR